MSALTDQQMMHLVRAADFVLPAARRTFVDSIIARLNLTGAPPSDADLSQAIRATLVGMGRQPRALLSQPYLTTPWQKELDDVSI